MARRESVAPESGRLSVLILKGDGPPVLLIHGNSSCAGIFAAQLDVLARLGRAAIAPDLPGHGCSNDARRPEETYSFPGYAAVIGQLLDALGVAQVDLVGWSLGGHVALELAATDVRARSALVTGAPPIAPAPEALEAAFATTPTMMLAGKAAPFDETDARAYVAAMLGGARFVTADLIGAAMRTDGRAREWMMRNGLAGVGIDQAAFVRSGAKPIAIVQGGRDPFLDRGYLEGFAGRSLWRGGAQWLDDLGHAPHVEAPERFDPLMLAFLTDVLKVHA